MKFILFFVVATFLILQCQSAPSKGSDEDFPQGTRLDVNSEKVKVNIFLILYLNFENLYFKIIQTKKKKE